MNEEQQKEFNEMAEEYAEFRHRMNFFISVNELDFDEIWSEVDLYYSNNYLIKINE